MRGGVHAGRLVLRAAAKVNLTLEILARRADGYHDLESVAQTLDLADEVTLEVAPGDALRVTTSAPGLPEDGANLAGRAALLLLEHLGLRAAVRIRIQKRIPVAAGLGGGSADAAAALWGLHRLFGQPLAASELFALAARLGSDVPYFLAGGTCLLAGRGERLRRLPALPPCRLILVAPRAQVETQAVYANRDKIGLTPHLGLTRMLASALRRRDLQEVALSFHNDLEEAVGDCLPLVIQVKDLLLGEGAIGAGMSGSGAAVFGLVEDLREAQRIATTLRDADHLAHVTRPVPWGLATSGAVE